ncbi:hypothetical protein K505DRAFT_320921 [Melanomma pulvis-pyrius CBS 109.77]|uniref:Uncharacterized protein n=1 Tax=Melanomma pulvis-pyrius CBS 109.77 TaxID=1314802 RepID=A0A6A6XTI1_9PLEO|nr:hypothetical protein K505DRAFT_320921 [Melanomma pulvis-pyrius CBS 109.77]
MLEHQTRHGHLERSPSPAHRHRLTCSPPSPLFSLRIRPRYDANKPGYTVQEKKQRKDSEAKQGYGGAQAHRANHSTHRSRIQ